jgi:hypothetical protein
LSLAAYHLYCVATKVRHWPRVLREYRPRLLLDETPRPAQGERYAIVVKYARMGLAPDFLDLLDALERAGINAIVVCNGALDPAAHDRLRQRVHRILVRANVGRDIGAYRAATLHLAGQGLRPARMLYLNDSVFYLKGPSLDEMIVALRDSTFDVAGTFENHEFSHHLGSYTLSLDGRVFNDAQVLRFWRGYRPYDLRPHAIRSGEIALSVCLKRQGYTMDALFGVERLMRHLQRLDLSGMLALVSHMRPAFRKIPLEQLMAQPMSALRMVPALAAAAPARPMALSRTPTLTGFRQHGAQLGGVPGLRGAGPRRPADVADELARQALIDHFMREVTRSSQIHMGFGLYRKLMQCPIVKKDLVLRDIYADYDCEALLGDLEEGQRTLIVREMGTRDRIAFAHGFKKFKLEHGLI